MMTLVGATKSRSQGKSEETWSPTPVLETLSGLHGNVWVVRDDLLAGGTKQRAAVSYLRRLQHDGFTRFVYASPFCGFAQVALAAACRNSGASCVLFCEVDRSVPGRAAHPFTLRAHALGARIVLCDSLEEAEAHASRMAARENATFQVPLGFDDDEFRRLLADELRRHWPSLVQRIGREPRALWISVGSGTLARTFRSILPDTVAIHGIDVHVLKGCDPRIRGLSDCAATKVIAAPESFTEPATHLPEIASNLHYDAKVWRFVREHALDGDVWWNIAR